MLSIMMTVHFEPAQRSQMPHLVEEVFKQN